MKDKAKLPIKETNEDSDVTKTTPLIEDQAAIKSKTPQPLASIIPQHLPEKSWRSPVWNNFTRDPEDLDRAICHLCDQGVYAKNTTSTMLQHIKNKHGAELDEPFFTD